jgi:uncharacterized protein (UPF0335 family)
MTSNSESALRAYVERIEAKEAIRTEAAEDIKEILLEAHSQGLDKKTIRRVVRDRRKDPEKLKAEEQLLAIYRQALGVLADTPLGRAAMAKV